jgi:hypothetical protein
MESVSPERVENLRSSILPIKATEKLTCGTRRGVAKSDFNICEERRSDDIFLCARVQTVEAQCGQNVPGAHLSIVLVALEHFVGGIVQRRGRLAQPVLALTGTLSAVSRCVRGSKHVQHLQDRVTN